MVAFQLLKQRIVLLICICNLIFTVKAFISPAARATHFLRSIMLRGSSDSETSKNTKQPHIVILGGGFGGINTALTLPTLPWSDKCIQPKITLIDKSERFVFLPLLYELCMEDASIDEVAPTFKSLLKDGNLPSLPGLPNLSGLVGASSSNDRTDEISFIQANVEGIDVKNKQVVVSSSLDKQTKAIEYDALVIATGAEISLDGIPGAFEFALPFYTIEQCLELKRRLALLDSCLEEKANNGDDRPINVVVVGGGYSGVELALNLVDRFGNTENDVHVSLVHRGEQVLNYATEYNRNAGIERLKLAGVNVMTSTSIVEVTPVQAEGSMIGNQRCHVKLQSDEGSTMIDTSLLLWTAGATPTSSRNEGIRNSILSRDVMGRILTSPTLNIPEYPNVFAIGDCSRPKKEPYPGTAQVAIPMATVAAWNIYATLVNDSTTSSEQLKLLPFTYLSLGEMMTLGRNDATISTLGGIEISGAGASWLRRLIYAVRMPTDRQRVAAAVDGTARKLARGALGASKKMSKPVDWK